MREKRSTIKGGGVAFKYKKTMVAKEDLVKSPSTKQVAWMVLLKWLFQRKSDITSIRRHMHNLLLVHCLSVKNM